MKFPTVVTATTERVTDDDTTFHTALLISNKNRTCIRKEL